MRSSRKNKVTVYEEGLFVLDNTVNVSSDNCDAIRYALFENEAVGAVAGYYDDRLSIVFASDIFLQNLGYSHEEFISKTDSSLLSVIYSENLDLFEVNRFRKSSGMNEFKMIAKDGSPINVRSFKTETKDERGRVMWVISVRINKEGQQLTLVNDIIQSGFWSIDYDEDGNISNVMWSNKIRQMLGYTDTNDLPNTIQVWKDSIYPEDKNFVLPIFNSIPNNRNRNNYDFEYRLKLKDGTYQWFRINAEVTRRINGT
jgi:PAS domain-containing protein